MKRYFIVSLLLLSCVSFGCASSVSYKFDKDMHKREKPLNYSAIVDVFEDTRPRTESAGYLDGKKDHAITSDNLFKPDIVRQVSDMLVKHLKEANVFKSVEVQNVDNELEKNSVAMNQLRSKGFDLVIIANLGHFYGYQSSMTSSGVSVLFGVVGVLAESMANPKVVGAKVEYADVKIIDLNKQKVVWRGNFDHSFEERDTFYDGPVVYALRALKEVNNKFVKDFPISDNQATNVNYVEEKNKIGNEKGISGKDTGGPREVLQPVVAPKQKTSINNAHKQVSPSPVSQSVSSYSEYQQYLYKTIANAIVKPKGSAAGTIKVSFTVRANGAVESVKFLEGSSEDSFLKIAVARAINDSSPFQPFPDDMKKESSKTFTMAIEFK